MNTGKGLELSGEKSRARAQTQTKTNGKVGKKRPEVALAGGQGYGTVMGRK